MCLELDLSKLPIGTYRSTYRYLPPLFRITNKAICTKTLSIVPKGTSSILVTYVASNDQYFISRNICQPVQKKWQEEKREEKKIEWKLQRFSLYKKINKSYMIERNLEWLGNKESFFVSSKFNSLPVLQLFG